MQFFICSARIIASCFCDQQMSNTLIISFYLSAPERKYNTERVRDVLRSIHTVRLRLLFFYRKKWVLLDSAFIWCDCTNINTKSHTAFQLCQINCSHNRTTCTVLYFLGLEALHFISQRCCCYDKYRILPQI